MPDNQHFYQEFMSALKAIIPKRALLANTITDLLAIDKDAVYRRLRGDVNFSFTEMAILAKKLGISLDSLVGIESELNKPAQVVLTNSVNPSEVDYLLFNDYINLLKFIKDEPDTRLLESSNAVPLSIYFDYDNLTRLYMFAWNLASNFGTAVPFHEIVIPERMRVIQKNYSYYSRHIKSTQYLWDRMIFKRMVDNIKFSVNINVIREEDIRLIKKELMEMLDDLEKLAGTGKFEDTGNKVSIYISDLLIETNHNCIKSKTMHLTQHKTFLLNAISSLDEDVFNEVSHWILSLQRKSTLISVSGEKIRTDYFTAQRKIIDSL